MKGCIEDKRRGVYITFGSRTVFSGVEKKIQNQIAVFSNYFQMQHICIEKPSFSYVKSLIWRLPFGSIDREYDKYITEIYQYDFIYIRYNYIDRKYYKFLQELKNNNPKAKIIVEIPTYPYDEEIKGNIANLPFLIKDRIYRKKLAGIIDRFVTFSDHDKIYGISTIKTHNGIIVDDVKAVSGKFNDDKCVLLAVAQMACHHGYERIIQGLHSYYASNKVSIPVYLFLVGEGKETQSYKKLADKFELQDKVIFFPKTYGEKLDNLYNISDIALGSFGMYKINFYGKASILKSRESLAAGMLFVNGCKLDVLDETNDYYLEYPNDDSEIDITKIIEFYMKHKNNATKQELSEEIRNYARKKVDMEAVLNPIIQYLLE